jgi:DNA-binding MarR family transcriptional regulator
MRRRDADGTARQLLTVVMLVMRSVAAEMRRSEQALAPAQLATLMRIAAGPCTMSDLARHRAVSLPTVSKSVEMLVRRKLVARRADAADRRQSVVRLTADGRRATRQMRQRAERHVATVLAPLPAAERALLDRALAALGPVRAAAAAPCGTAPDRTRPATRATGQPRPARRTAGR